MGDNARVERTKLHSNCRDAGLVRRVSRTRSHPYFWPRHYMDIGAMFPFCHYNIENSTIKILGDSWPLFTVAIARILTHLAQFQSEDFYRQAVMFYINYMAHLLHS